MHSTKKTLKQRQFRLFRALVATAFITNGIFPLIAPAFADGTAAGTSISNTATAEYEDPNVPGTKIPATSNTVTVTVAEVAGITVTAQTPTDTTGGTVQVGDLLIYNFTITNTGNDPTTFRIPNTATVIGPGTVTGTLPNGGTANNLQYSIDNGTTWVTLSATEGFTPSIPAFNPSNPTGNTVLVRVPVTVGTAAVAGETINVTLGNTPADAQNQPLDPAVPAANATDVYTKDNTNPATNIPGQEVIGTPSNGEREAAATSTISVGTKDYALATILKTRTAYSNNSTQSNITDDTVTYGLSLNVLNTPPAGTNINPVALQGISGINIDGASGTYILVSDAIPAATELNAAPTPPNANWEAVYTTSPVGTDANAANWIRFSTTAPTLADVTRVGFINTATLTSVAPGTTVTGFSVTVKVKATATAPLTIANIAQLFGGSPNGTNPTPVLPIYDESGDNDPSNYDPTSPNPLKFPGTDTNGDGIPDTIPPAAVDDGYIIDPTDLTNTGTDTSGNNGGDTNNPAANPGGEANVLIIDTSSLLNGPNGNAGAFGPTNDNNTDFTNKSSAVPAGTAPGSTIDPAVVNFINTVQNTGSSSAPIKLVPTPPATATDLPNDTTVTITDSNNTANTATYSYNSATGFSLTSGTPVVLTVASNSTANYNVVINLPATTPLSTDIDRGFPVPITAFIDSNGDNTPNNGEVANITIDRVYTGFLKLVKFSRILDASGNDLTGARAGESDFATTPNVDADTSNDVPRNPRPGEIIEYQIRYKNISVSATNAAGSVILNVSNLVITEDGTGPNGNWAVLGTDAVIDTSNVANSAVDSVPASAIITYFSGNPATTPVNAATSGTTISSDVTKYVNSITVQIAPGVERTFTFRRKVN